MIVSNFLELLDSIGDQAHQDALEIFQLIALMETRNQTSANKRLSDAGAGRAVNCLQNALISRIVLLVARCYSKPRDGDLSVAQAFDLMFKKTDVRQELERLNPAGAVTDAMDFWRLCKGDHRLGSIDHFRDKYTAHISEPNAEIALPRYKELFDFSRQTARLMQKLSNVACLTNHDLSDWNDELVGSATALWKPWLR